MTKEKIQTIEEKVNLIIQKIEGNYECYSIHDISELDYLNDKERLINQIISIVRADERKRIREGIEKETYMDDYDVKVARFIDILDLLSNEDTNTKEGG